MAACSKCASQRWQALTNLALEGVGADRFVALHMVIVALPQVGHQAVVLRGDKKFAHFLDQRVIVAAAGRPGQLLGLIDFESRANVWEEPAIELQDVGVDNGVVDFLAADQFEQVFNAGVFHDLPIEIRHCTIEYQLVAGAFENAQPAALEIVQAFGAAIAPTIDDNR